MSAIKRRAVVSGLLGASASCIGKIALDPESLVQSKARGICNLFVSADATRTISVIGASVQSGDVCTAVEVCIRGLCLLLMILTNAVMMTMNESGTVAGTALANAANFTLSAIYGVLFFEETHHYNVDGGVCNDFGRGLDLVEHSIEGKSCRYQRGQER